MLKYITMVLISFSLIADSPAYQLRQEVKGQIEVGMPFIISPNLSPRDLVRIEIIRQSMSPDCIPVIFLFSKSALTYLAKVIEEDVINS